MGFAMYSNAHGAVVPLEYLEAAAGDYEPGQLLTFAEGKLSAVAEDDAGIPPYICHAHKTVTETDNILPVEAIAHDAIYETILEAAEAEAKPGAAMKVKTGGLSPTGTGGSFVVVYASGQAEGDTVRGRFAPQTAAASEAV